MPPWAPIMTAPLAPSMTPMTPRTDLPPSAPACSAASPAARVRRGRSSASPSPPPLPAARGSSAPRPATRTSRCPPKVQAAVDKALDWLAKNQKSDGTWQAGTRYQHLRPVAGGHGVSRPRPRPRPGALRRRDQQGHRLRPRPAEGRRPARPATTATPTCTSTASAPPCSPSTSAWWTTPARRRSTSALERAVQADPVDAQKPARAAQAHAVHRRLALPEERPRTPTSPSPAGN